MLVGVSPAMRDFISEYIAQRLCRLSHWITNICWKLMRVFNEPKAVAGLLSRLGDFQHANEVDNMPDAANMPVLGLSNKAIETISDDQEVLPVDDRDREAMECAMPTLSQLDASLRR